MDTLKVSFLCDLKEGVDKEEMIHTLKKYLADTMTGDEYPEIETVFSVQVEEVKE